LRFVEQLVAEACLLKSDQVRRRGKAASGRAALDLASALVIPDFGLRLSVMRHSGITDRQIRNRLPWLVETGVIHSGRLINMLLDITVIVLVLHLLDNGA